MNHIERFTMLFEIIIKLLFFSCFALPWGLGSILVLWHLGTPRSKIWRLFFLALAWKCRNGALPVLLGKFWASWNLPRCPWSHHFDVLICLQNISFCKKILIYSRPPFYYSSKIVKRVLKAETLLRHPYVINSNLMKKQVLVCLVYRWGNWSPESRSALPRTMAAWDPGPRPPDLVLTNTACSLTTEASPRSHFPCVYFCLSLLSALSISVSGPTLPVILQFGSIVALQRCFQTLLGTLGTVHPVSVVSIEYICA